MNLIVTSIAAGTLLVARAPAQPSRYNVTDLGTFGGTSSIAFSINNAGRVAGAANVPGEHQHPFLLGIAKTDLGTLGGPNAQAGGPSGDFEMSILSEINKTDPLGEDFCGFGTHLICLGASWNGAMTPLPTLGGNNAMAFNLNNRGQIIGVAETSTKDKACPAPQSLDFQGVMWGPGPLDVQALAPLPGDTVSFALSINDLGQVVGSSGTCADTTVTAVGLLSGAHAVLWENGSVTDLGSLGGHQGKACAINNRSEVVGFSSVAGDTAVHPFFWTKETGMRDLGPLGADTLADPAGINNNSQAVGGSCDDTGNCRAFLWQKNVMTDLNDLVPVDSPLYLLYALGINDAGEIVGFALQISTGEVHAYLATPIRASKAEPEVSLERKPVVLPDHVRRLLRQRLHH